MTWIEPSIDTLARTMYGEARGEGTAGKVAVAHVVVNRVQADSWWGKTVIGVCRYPWQFSSWNRSDPNREIILRVSLRSAVFRECVRLAGEVLSGQRADPTKGATHFMTRARAAKGWPKSWGPPRRPVAAIGRHLFYRGIG